MFIVKGKFNQAKVFANTVDVDTMSQIYNLCNQEWLKGSNIAIMPDTHYGKSSTVGTTLTIGDKICPALIGTDIGCGMLTIKLPRELGEIDLKKLDKFINVKIRHGAQINSKRLYNPIHERLYLSELHCYKQLNNPEKLEKGCGSLGSGNHFIELDKDDENNIYLVIHSGSRKLGMEIGSYYQRMANEYCNDNNIHVMKSFSYLEGEMLQDFLHDVNICQHYAQVNRKLIALQILKHLFNERYYAKNGNIYIDTDECGYDDENIDVRFESFETVHNYISQNDNILRKGAISMHKGEMVLIPINMRDGAIIAVGKGNPEYNYSGPHGAGRLMSRAEAKELITLEEFSATMKDVYTTSVRESTVDESPMVYKSMNEILDNIKDTAEIVKIIKPIYNFKSHSER